MFFRLQDCAVHFAHTGIGWMCHRARASDCGECRLQSWSHPQTNLTARHGAPNIQPPEWSVHQATSPRLWTALALILFTATGCGQKGDLRLPEPEPPSAGEAGPGVSVHTPPGYAPPLGYPGVFPQADKDTHD